MFKLEDIAMLIKRISEKELKKMLNIKDLEFYEEDSHELSSKCSFKIVFKVKQTVNRPELIKKISDTITKSVAHKLDLFYKNKWREEPMIRDSFCLFSAQLLSKSKSNVGSRGNINYISLKFRIEDMYDGENIEFKVKNAIRDIKLAQLRINI